MRTMETETITAELSASSAQIDPASLSALCDRIRSAQRVFVYGTGRSGLMLKALAMRLMQIGCTSYVVGETTTPTIQPGDLLITASASGETGSVCAMASSALEQGAAVAVITATPNSSLARLQTPDLVIASPTKHAESSASVQPLGSLFEQMLLVVSDALVLRFTASGEASNAGMAHRHASLE